MRTGAVKLLSGSSCKSHRRQFIAWTVDSEMQRRIVLHVDCQWTWSRYQQKLQQTSVLLQFFSKDCKPTQKCTVHKMNINLIGKEQFVLSFHCTNYWRFTEGDVDWTLISRQMLSCINSDIITTCVAGVTGRQAADDTVVCPCAHLCNIKTTSKCSIVEWSHTKPIACIHICSSTNKPL